MARKKIIFKVIAVCDYRDRRTAYCVGEFGTMREAKACLARQYDTASRSHYIEAVTINV